MISKAKVAVIFLVAMLLAGYLSLKYLFAVKIDGILYLKNARGSATITREPDTLIPHIRGDSWESAIYAQGFL